MGITLSERVVLWWLIIANTVTAMLIVVVSIGVPILVAEKAARVDADQVSRAAVKSLHEMEVLNASRQAATDEVVVTVTQMIQDIRAMNPDGVIADQWRVRDQVTRGGVPHVTVDD